MEENFTLEVVASNYCWVLTRIVTQFSKRGINIDSIFAKAVKGTEFSRIIIDVCSNQDIKEQIIKQLNKLPDVKKIELI